MLQQHLNIYILYIDQPSCNIFSTAHSTSVPLIRGGVRGGIVHCAHLTILYNNFKMTFPFFTTRCTSAKVYYANTNLLLLFSNHVQTMPELNLSWVPTKPVQNGLKEKERWAYSYSLPPYCMVLILFSNQCIAMAEKNMHFQIPYQSTLKGDLRGHFRELKRGDQSILGGGKQIESRKPLHLKRENIFLFFVVYICSTCFF